MQPVSSVDLTHHFLIAMPNMVDPYFARSLTYICEHMKDENACKGPSYDAYLTELALILAEGKRQGCSFAG